MAKRNKEQTRQQKRQLKSEQLVKSEQLENQPQKSELQNPKNKTWKRAGLFDTYVKASEFKTKLLEQSDSLEVKILRHGDGGNQFQVKLWSPTGTKKARKPRKRDKN